MFGSLVCSLRGHTDETEDEYQWDVPFNIHSIPEESKDGGFAPYKWKHCRRCGVLVETELVTVEEAPSPIETAPLL